MTMLVVIWALGWAMIVLPALVLAAGAGDSRLRPGDGRRPQPPRRRALGASAVGHAARAGRRREPPGLRGLRRLSAGAVGGRHGARLRAGPDLPVGRRAPARVPAARAAWR